MAAGKVKTTDIIEEKIFQEPTESALAFLKALENIENQMKQVLAASAKTGGANMFANYKNIKDVEQGINDATKAVETLTAAEKERIKLEQKLLDLQSEEIKKNAELRLQIQEQTKANKEAAREKLNMISLYQKESARLNDLRKAYKDLAVQNKQNTKEGKELLKNIQELDTKLKDIDASVGQFQRSVGNYEKAVNGLSGALKALAASTGVLALLGGLKEIFAGTTSGANSMEKAIAQVSVRLTVFVGIMLEAFTKVDSTLSTYAQIEAFFKNLRSGLGTFNERVEKGLELTNKAIDVNTDYAKSIAVITTEIARLSKEQAILEVQAEDNTTTFEAQTAAANKLLDTNIQKATEELKLLNLQRKAIQLRRDAFKEASGGTEKNIELEKEYAAIITEIADKESELAKTTAEIEKKKREDLSDTAELRLDVLIDGFDTVKTVNERIIADETITLEKRRALFLETQKNALNSFNDQIAVLQNFATEKIDADKLINESDGIRMAEEMKRVGLSEILQTRLLEVVRERKAAVQDFAEVEKQLRLDETEALKKNVALQEQALEMLKKRGQTLESVQKKLAESTLKQEIENLKAKQKLMEKDSPEELRIRQELNDKILAQESARIEKQKKKEEELRDATLKTLQTLVDKRAEKILSGLDKQISEVEKRQDQLRELAAKGAQDATENLALEQKKQAELEAERERAIRNQKRLQLGLSAIETYSKKVAAGDENPLGSTIVDISLLQAFIESLPGFYSGAERISDSATPTLPTAIDSYLVRLDGSERVLTGVQNSMVGSLTNNELANLAHRFNTGNLGGDASGELLGRLDKLISIEQSKPVYLGRDYDATERAVIDSIKYQGRIEHNKKRAGRLF